MSLLKDTSRGFTLIELLVVIAIVAVIAAIVVVLVNPLEIMRKSRDATRLADLKAIMKSVEVGVQDAGGPATSFFCHSPSTVPCTGTSNAIGNMRINDGTGWVKINFAAMPTVTVTTLPMDPVNDSNYFYTYSSDGSQYEFNAVLESSQYQSQMQNDGGNNSDVYEIGSSLTLIN